MDDREIIDLFFQRNQDAIEAARARYGGGCGAVARRILGSDEDAEECVSDALLAAWNAIPPQRPKSLGAFLTALTRNGALDRLRREDAKKRGGGEAALALHELEEAVPAPGSVEEAVEQTLLAESLERFLRGLSDRDRRAFLRRYWYLCPVKEVAALGGMSESGTASLLRRLRKKLKQHLEKEGISL